MGKKQENTLRRFLVMCIGIVILSLGIALFKISLMGNDPSTALMMAIGGRIGIDFSIVLLVMNCLFFGVEIVWGRHYIGIGTFVNWFFVGSIASLYLRVFEYYHWAPVAFLSRLGVMCVGVLVLSFACSLYQTADMGIAPYDCLSLVLHDRMHVQYFWCRMFTDAFCAGAAFLLGGIVGLGTLVCALGLGPFVEFFTKHVAQTLCGYKKNVPISR